MVTSSKESITLKVHELIDLFSKEVTQLDKLCVRIKDNVDVLIGVTRTLMEDIWASNKEYVRELKLKKESDGKVFTNIENYLMSFHDSLSKFYFPLTTLIFEDQISSVISSVESSYSLITHQCSMTINERVTRGDIRGCLFKRRWRRQKKSSWEAVFYSNPNFTPNEIHYDGFGNTYNSKCRSWYVEATIEERFEHKRRRLRFFNS